MKYLTRRLGGLLSRGDGDVEAQADEARELDRMAANLERSVDPFEGRTGPMRRALRSPIDGDYSEVGRLRPALVQAERDARSTRSSSASTA